ncbi:MAG: sigma-54 dependent transcriptional regulator [Mariprofundaceae bacterium]
MKQEAFVLLIDDEEELRSALAEALEGAKYHVQAEGSAMKARAAMEHGKYDVVILDVQLPDGNGVDLLQEFRTSNPDIGIIMITGYAEVDIAVDSMRYGADDFLKKPFTPDELLVRTQKVLKKRNLERDHKALSVRENTRQAQKMMIGQCAGIQQVLQTIELLADSESTVMITGESGTGKEVLAKVLHHSGLRASKPMVSVNCGAIPEELLESELFGHVKGAFTGAIRARSGRFEVANGGTIFLDEIGDMSPQLQVKLLRVLQERCFEPVGSSQSIHVDVRVVAATHQNLEKLIEEGRFREDLFYRLNVIPIQLPPLRDRGEDILLFADHFIRRFNAEKAAKIEGMDDEARDIMLRYGWPGNVRELQNLVERIATLKRHGFISVDDLPVKMLNIRERMQKQLQLDMVGEEQLDLKNMVDEFENRLLLSALQRFDWNKNQAASFLSMNRTTLVEKIKKKGLKPVSS